MKKTAPAALAMAALTGLGLAATATTLPPPTPSVAMGIDVDVKPVEGQPGQYMVSSVVTDLESDTVIARPRLLIAANKTARIEAGSEGKWLLRISVTADGPTRKADYDASFTREGKLVSRQRISVKLDG